MCRQKSVMANWMQQSPAFTTAIARASGISSSYTALSSFCQFWATSNYCFGGADTGFRPVPPRREFSLDLVPKLPDRGTRVRSLYITWSTTCISLLLRFQRQRGGSKLLWDFYVLLVQLSFMSDNLEAGRGKAGEWRGVGWEVLDWMDMISSGKKGLHKRYSYERAPPNEQKKSKDMHNYKEQTWKIEVWLVSNITVSAGLFSYFIQYLVVG